MQQEHVIADNLLASALKEFQVGRYYIAYNSINYFLDETDMYFFKTKDEADEFSASNISEYDDFNVIYASSPDELLRQISYGEELQIYLTSKNLSPMNENNLKYLQDNLKYHGFGENLNTELANQILKGNAEFSLAFKSEINKREVEATLHFRKPEGSEYYFFNTYDARIKNEKDETLTQTFYMNNGSGMTVKEAYNLLNGRAVFKELTNKDSEKYHAWVQLDLSSKDAKGNYERKQYHQNYGYDLKEALSYFPVKEMLKEDAAKDLVRSLERGNVQMVTLDVAGKEVKVFLEANPQYKSLQLYNGKMERLDKEARQEMMQKPAMKEPVKEQQQENRNDKAEKKSLLPKNEKGNGLLARKKTNKSKGIELK